MRNLSCHHEQASACEGSAFGSRRKSRYLASLVMTTRGVLMPRCAAVSRIESEWTAIDREMPQRGSPPLLTTAFAPAFVRHPSSPFGAGSISRLLQPPLSPLVRFVQIV